MNTNAARRFPTQYLTTRPTRTEARREAYVASSEDPRIVVSLLTFIGETVLALPSVTALRQAFPNARIVAIALNSNAEVIQDNAAVDYVRICGLHSYDLDSILRPRSYARLAGLIRWIGLHSFDIGVELMPATKWLFRLDGVQTIAGYPLNDLRVITAKRAAASAGLHAVERYLGIVETLGASTHDTCIHLVRDRTAKRFADMVLLESKVRPHKPLIGTHVGAGARAKRWSALGFAQLSNTIVADYGAQILLVGGKNEMGLRQMAPKGIPATLSEPLQADACRG